MTYRGVVKRGLIELEGEVTLPEGTRVSVAPEEPLAIDSRTSTMTLKEWLQKARQVRAQLSTIGDSAEILRRLREERAHR
ncbi:MAG TPA: hypothetical protein VGC99_24550 [Candidatus Tectomicrobia bacterium]